MTCFHRNKNGIIKCKNQTLKQIDDVILISSRLP
jgi:hypothetical protein